jgi:hypothetical protein
MLSSLYGKYENCTLLIKSVGRCTGWAGYIHMYKSNVVFFKYKQLYGSKGCTEHSMVKLVVCHFSESESGDY